MALANPAQRTAAPAPGRPTRARRARWWAEIGWKYPVGLVIVFYAVFPLVYALSAALDPSGSLAGSSSLFRTIGLDNFLALGDTLYWTWVGNTLLIGGVASFGAVLMGAAGRSPRCSSSRCSRRPSRSSPCSCCSSRWAT